MSQSSHSSSEASSDAPGSTIEVSMLPPPISSVQESQSSVKEEPLSKTSQRQIDTRMGSPDPSLSGNLDLDQSMRNYVNLATEESDHGLEISQPSPDREGSQRSDKSEYPEEFGGQSSADEQYPEEFGGQSSDDSADEQYPEEFGGQSSDPKHSESDENHPDEFVDQMSDHAPKHSESDEEYPDEFGGQSSDHDPKYPEEFGGQSSDDSADKQYPEEFGGQSSDPKHSESDEEYPDEFDEQTSEKETDTASKHPEKHDSDQAEKTNDQMSIHSEESDPYSPQYNAPNLEKSSETHKRRRSPSPDVPKKKSRQIIEERSQIVNPLPFPKCILKLPDMVPVGSAFQNPKQWNISLNLDAGRYGQPSLGLKFYFNEYVRVNTNRAVQVTARTFQIDWYPGIKVRNEFMMSYFESGFMRDGQVDILDHIPEKLRKNGLSNMMYISFSSHTYSLTSGAYQQTGWSHLAQDDRNVLDIMFPHPDYYLKIIIFFIPPNVDIFRTSCLPFFLKAVTYRIPNQLAYTDDQGGKLLFYDPNQRCLRTRRGLRKRKWNSDIAEEPQDDSNSDSEVLETSSMPGASRLVINDPNPEGSSSNEKVDIAEEISIDKMDTVEETVDREYRSGSEEGEIIE